MSVGESRLPGHLEAQQVHRRPDDLCCRQLHFTPAVLPEDLHILEGVASLLDFGNRLGGERLEVENVVVVGSDVGPERTSNSFRVQEAVAGGVI